MNSAKLWMLVVLAVSSVWVFAACSDQFSSQGSLGSELLGLAAKPEPPDIAGEYAWSETQDFLLSVDLAGLIGIVPEGTHTHVTCENSGTMVFVQDGASFEGAAGQDGNCVTTGGQNFGFDVPFPFIPLVDGRISGRTVRFGFSSPLCPYTGVLQYDDGEVVGIGGGGTGQCRPPFSLDGTPPFDQLAVTSRWQATRID